MQEAVHMKPIYSAASNLNDDRDSEPVFIRLAMFISLVMKSPLAKRSVAMSPLNMHLGISATVHRGKQVHRMDGKISLQPQQCATTSVS